MTVTVQTNYVALTQTAVVADTPIAFGANLDKASEIQVWYNGDQMAVLNTHYTVQLAADFMTATVTPLAALVALLDVNNKLILRRKPDYLQPIDATSIQGLPETRLEKFMDRTAQQLMSLQDQMDRAVLQSSGLEAVGISLPAFDADKAIVFGPVSGLTTGPAVADISAIPGNVAAAAASEAAAAASATAASGSATSAGSSLDGANSAALTAEQHRDQALLIFENANGTYLGHKTSDPALNNEGGALVGGNLYYNTTTPAMRRYTGSAWTDAYVNGAASLPLGGGTMTGNIVLVGDASANLHPVSKQQFDTKTSNIDNTSDTDKPISTAAAAKHATQDTAIALNTAKISYPTSDSSKLGGIEAGAKNNAGKHMLPFDAAAMRAGLTSGAEFGFEETATQLVMLDYFKFDDTTEEYVQFKFMLPKSYNGSTITSRFTWMAETATSGDVVWTIQSAALGDGQATDVVWGATVAVTDTAPDTAKKQAISNETGVITIAGAAAEKMCYVRIFRDADAAGDTMVGDALLLGVELFITTNAGTDA